jgi:hypothetical protein
MVNDSNDDSSLWQRAVLARRRQNRLSNRRISYSTWTLSTLAILLVLSLLHHPTAHAFSLLKQKSNGHSMTATTSTRVAPGSCHSVSSTTLWRQPSKWDLILDDDEDDSDEEDNDGDTVAGPRQYTSCPPDMMYEVRIVQRAHQTFHAIRQAGGKETTNDVYVRDPVDKQVMWYTGKVARVSDISLEECIHRLYPMIERHACHLRPKELYPHRGEEGALEVWTAPGDSELEVAYNRPSVRLQRFVHSKDWQYKAKDSKYPSHVKASMVGFQGEVYQEGEDGFRTWRHDDGMPARPELNPGGESRPPTEEEVIQYQKEVQKVYSSSEGESGDSDIIDAVITSDVESNAESDVDS